MEFDPTIKTKKLIKDQGLAKFLVESNCKVLRINFVLEIQGKNPQEPYVLTEGKNPQEPSQTLDKNNTEEPSVLAEAKNT